MNDHLFLTTFPSRGNYERAFQKLKEINVPYDFIHPTPPLKYVALPALIVSRDTRAVLEEDGGIIFSGWVDYCPSSRPLPEGEEPKETAPCLERVVITVLNPCVADYRKIRLIAQIDGDLTSLMPYLNAVLPQASYNSKSQTLTFMEGYRMIALYPERITLAKADDIIDAWLTLERIRLLVVRTCLGREKIVPSFERRERPPAVEIYKRLPKTNCGLCGEFTCLAFALKVWLGEVSLARCRPVFDDEGTYTHLREPLKEICSGMGLI